jgi:nicotinamidase-related amidase
MMDARQTALILVGYQNDYFGQDGILRGVVEEPGRVDEILRNTLGLIEALRPTPVTIVATPIVLTADYRAMTDPVGILNTIKESGAFRVGTSGAATIDELKALGDRIDYVDGKVGFNAFADTRLHDLLVSRGTRNVLVCGMVTSLCIDSTGRAAYERGYNVTIVSDCTSGRSSTEHDFYCRNIFPLYGRAADSHTLIGELLQAAA